MFFGNFSYSFYPNEDYRYQIKQKQEWKNHKSEKLAFYLIAIVKILPYETEINVDLVCFSCICG